MDCDIDAVCQWFQNFVKGYYESCGRARELVLKEKHSHRVASVCGFVAAELGWGPGEVRFARALGLLHDVGRFPQYKEYRTFFDAQSVDHGDRGARVLDEEMEEFLFSARERRILKKCVELHNKKEIPPHISQETLPWLKLVRDGDKVDIFCIVRGYVERGEMNSLYPGLLPEGTCTPELLDFLRHNHRAPYTMLRSLSDVLLFQLCWVYDMNYQASLLMLLRQGHVDWLLERLPRTAQVSAITENIVAKLAPLRELL